MIKLMIWNTEYSEQTCAVMAFESFEFTNNLIKTKQWLIITITISSNVIGA